MESSMPARIFFESSVAMAESTTCSQYSKSMNAIDKLRAIAICLLFFIFSLLAEVDSVSADRHRFLDFFFAFSNLRGVRLSERDIFCASSLSTNSECELVKSCDELLGLEFAVFTEEDD